MNDQVCIIASDRPWNKDMATHLSGFEGYHFELINEPLQLTMENLQKLKPRYVFFPHWSHKISTEIFTTFECVIFHMTDLPFGRGGSPLQNLIVRGMTETKMSALKCVEEMDAGPIYLKQPLGLQGTAEEIFTRASDIIEKMIKSIIVGNLKPQPQTGDVVTFKRRRPEEGSLNACTTIQQAFDYIRMLDAEGYPSAFLESANLKLEFSKARLTNDTLTAEVRIKGRMK